MNLNGGGYTFINPKDFATLTNEEVQAMFTDKTNFLMRVRRDSDATQPYGVLEQLPQYQYVQRHVFLTDKSQSFLSRVSILTRDIDIANLSVCLSVSPSVQERFLVM